VGELVETTGLQNRYTKVSRQFKSDHLLKNMPLWRNRYTRQI